MTTRKLRRAELTVTIQVVELGLESCLAVTTLGGMTIRGERSADPFAAIRSLFAGLSGSPAVSTHQDAAIALDLELAGMTLQNVAASSRPAITARRR